MPYFIGLIVALVGMGYLLRQMTHNQTKIAYPDAKTLIVEPTSDIPLEQRILQLEGGVNFRDIGGYLTNDGYITRTGRLYRSGTISKLTNNDWQKLSELGIKFICDLRSDEEVLTDPDNVPDGGGVIYLHNPVKGDTSRFAQLQALFFNKRRIATMLPDTYTKLVIDQNADVIGETLKRLANPDNLPAIMHCTAGKDRTGVITAILLALLNVPDEVITADYSLSNFYYDNFYEIAEIALKPIMRFGVSTDDVQPLLSADTKVMQIVLDYIRKNYGSVEGYVKNKAGLHDTEIAALRENFLQTA